MRNEKQPSGENARPERTSFNLENQSPVPYESLVTLQQRLQALENHYGHQNAHDDSNVVPQIARVAPMSARNEPEQRASLPSINYRPAAGIVDLSALQLPNPTAAAFADAAAAAGAVSTTAATAAAAAAAAAPTRVAAVRPASHAAVHDAPHSAAHATAAANTAANPATMMRFIPITPSIDHLIAFDNDLNFRMYNEYASGMRDEHIRMTIDIHGRGGPSTSSANAGHGGGPSTSSGASSSTNAHYYGCGAAFTSNSDTESASSTETASANDHDYDMVPAFRRRALESLDDAPALARRRERDDHDDEDVMMAEEAVPRKKPKRSVQHDDDDDDKMDCGE